MLSKLIKFGFNVLLTFILIGLIIFIIIKPDRIKVIGNINTEKFTLDMKDLITKSMTKQKK